MKWSILGLCVLMGFLRFVLPAEGVVATEDIFKDLAHIFVGVLIGLACGMKKWTPYGWAAIGMTVLEVGAFLISRK